MNNSLSGSKVVETPNQHMRIFKMAEKVEPWIDPDDTPELTKDWFEKSHSQER